MLMNKLKEYQVLYINSKSSMAGIIKIFKPWHDDSCHSSNCPMSLKLSHPFGGLATKIQFLLFNLYKNRKVTIQRYSAIGHDKFSNLK